MFLHNKRYPIFHLKESDENKQTNGRTEKRSIEPPLSALGKNVHEWGT